MIKFASITLTCLAVSWLRVASTPALLADHQTFELMGACTGLWVILFGAYFGWFLLLKMVRQLGAAIRGK